jgi:hypothetical protein
VARPQLVEVESITYEAVCTSNPCRINVTVTEKMVRLACGCPDRTPCLARPARPAPAPRPTHTASPSFPIGRIGQTATG